MKATLWVLGLVIALLVSAAYHLQLPFAGHVAVQILTETLNDEIEGEISVTSLQNVSFEKIVARGVVISDPDGRPVIRVARLAAWPDWDAFLRDGAIRIERVRVRRAEVTLRPDDSPGRPPVSLVGAFMPAHPSAPDPNSEPPRVVVDNIVLDEVTVRGDVPGYEGIRVEQLRVRARVIAERDVRFDVYEGRGLITGPYRGRTQLGQLAGHFSTDLSDPNQGLDVFARISRGEDRVRTRVRLHQAENAEVPYLDISAALEPVQIATLAEMEVTEGLGSLSGTVRGFARLHGPVNDLSLRLMLGSEAGIVQGEGAIGGQDPFRLRVQSHAFRIHRLVQNSPDLSVAGEAEIRVVPDGDPILVAHVEPTSLMGYALPAFDFRGAIGDEALAIHEVTTDHLEGMTRGNGRIGYDGSLELHLESRLQDIGEDPNIQRFAAGAHGRVQARLDARAGPEVSDLEVRGRLTLSDLRYGAITARRVSLSGDVSDGEPPTIDALATAEDVRFGPIDIDRARISVDTRGGSYPVEATASGSGGRSLHAVATVRPSEGDFHITSDSIRIDPGDGPWIGRASVELDPTNHVRIRTLQLERRAEEILARGVYRFDGPDDLDIVLARVELEHLRMLNPDALATLEGSTSGRIQLQGDIDRHPQGRISLLLAGGRYRTLREANGELELGLTGETLDTWVHLDWGAHGSLDVNGPVELTRAALADPSRIVRDAELGHLDVRVQNLDLAPLIALSGQDLNIDGRVTAEADVSGPVQHPRLDRAVLILDHVGLESFDPLRAKLLVRYNEDRVFVDRLWLADRGGALLVAEGDLPLNIEDPPTSGRDLWRRMYAQGWHATVRVPDRRLDQWPAPIGPYIPNGLAASAEIVARGDQSGPHATVRLTAGWEESPVAHSCAEGLRPRFEVQADLDGTLAVAQLEGRFGAQNPDLRARVEARLPLDQWVSEGQVAAFPATELRAQFDELDIGTIPWLCQYGTGPASGHVTVKDLLTGNPVVGAIVDLPSVRVWEGVGHRRERQLSPPYRVHLRAGSDPGYDALTACAVLSATEVPGTQGNDCRQARPRLGEMIARLRVPVEWQRGILLPRLHPDGGITAWAGLNHVEVEPVLSLTPQIVGGTARLDGELAARGAWPAINVEGAVDVSEGRLQIEGLGQHLQRVEGRLVFENNRIVIPASQPLRARDAGGEARIYGRVDFQELHPREARLAVNLDQFPVRREGMVLAWLAGHARLNATIEGGRTESALRTHNLTVQLPDQLTTSLQGLEPHPEVLVVGQRRPSSGTGPEESYELVVDVDASEPFWVRRNDFGVQVVANIHATYRDPLLRIGGTAEIRRGTFEIFGKRFELTEGTIQFNPEDTELDPAVRIVAVYNVPGSSAGTVTVTVTGSLTRPRVSFSSSETTDRAEIIALLVAGRRREPGTAQQDVIDQATQDATSMVAGMVAGVLTLGLRQEFGNVIPVLAIESQGAGGTLVRAGFNANDLIPDFLRGVVTGAYVEGFFSATADGQNAAGSSAGNGGVGGGVTVEFTFPENFLFRGTYVPVDSGSLDLLWEP